MRTVVIGAEGQLGSDVIQEFDRVGDDLVKLNHADLEVASADSVWQSLSAIKPQIVVNTAAFHNVENCEQDPAKAFAVNAIGVRNLAQAANDLGCVLIHISTDYVFDGTKGLPYLECDNPRPLNVYGNSKLAGEYFARSITKRHFIFRTSAIYGRQPCRAKGGLNFVELMRKLARERGEAKVVATEFVTPTPTRDLASQIVKMSRCDAYGLYHATAEGYCSWYEFAGEIFRLTNTSVRLEMANPQEARTKVPRPKYSVLENSALKAIGVNVFRPWQEGLKEYLGLTPPKCHQFNNFVAEVS
jgi:dTDP-4-dehydrorhamnose reductase